MAQADTIKEFLVSLGFSIDAASERRFVDSIGAATVKAVALGAAVTGAATAVVAGVARIADNLEQLYFASQRTNASVENLQSLGFAAKQMGVDAGTALGAVESLARFLRNSPGGEGLLKNLGVQTRDANGQMRDTVDLMGDLGKTFADMPYYKAHAFASALGIDEKTLMAMRQGMGDFQAEYKAMLHSAGVDSQAAAKSSHEFMVEVRSWGASIGVLAMKVMSQLTGPMGSGLRRLRESFVSNFDWIASAIGIVVGTIGTAINVVVALASRIGQIIHWIAEWFMHLTPAGKALIEVIGGVAVAWRALSIAMALSPIGIVIALATAILALWDDYQTWKEGGKSLIDWSAWAPGIEAAIKGMKWLGDVLRDILDWTGQIGGAMARGIPALISEIGGLAVTLAKEISRRFSDALDFTSAIRRQVRGAMSFFEHHDSIAQRTGSGKISTAPASAGGAQPSTANGPRGIRNNNPGNINYGDFARLHGSTGVEAGPGGRFATFRSAQEGLNALADLLTSKSYIGGGLDSLSAIINKYAPSKDHNNTAAYIAALSKRMGVDANAHLDPRNMQQMMGLIDGIVRVENGKNPYSNEMIQGAAARGVSMSQSTSITVHSSGDSKAIAHDVAQAQNGVNGQLLRNTRGAILQ